MIQENMVNEYLSAKKLGVKEYKYSISQGESGYLPFLEGIIKNVDIISEVDLGIVEVPVKKIKGTYTYMRSISFAKNFMPIMDEDTEFADKWDNVCNAQLNEGLRDPIRVYEYLNWFYVVEGNKRVSVLKYLNIDFFPASIIRLVPKYDENDIDIKIYYEFLDFYKETGINLIWFSKEGSFKDLLTYLKDYELSSKLLVDKDKYKIIKNSIYMQFRKIYYQLGGNLLPITTGDAFLEYIKLYGIPDDFNEIELKNKLKRFILELDYYSDNKTVDIQTVPNLHKESNIISKLTTILKNEEVNVGFLFAKNIKESSWTYAHYLGKMHLENVLKNNITIQSQFEVPENLDAYSNIKEMINSGCNVIFATSPSFINATLKAAMEYPNVIFLNCSGVHSFKHVNTYFGRIFEPRFLSGIIAGAMTKTNTIGYVAPFPLNEVVCGINAFALGVKMINPEAKVLLQWMMSWDDEKKSNEAQSILKNNGADIVSHHNTLSNKHFLKDYGVYTMMSKNEGEIGPEEHIAAPVWNFGIFYEKIVKSIIAGGFKNFYDHSGITGKQVRNFWWGMDSGVIDFFYSKRLVPLETQKLIDLIKQSIVTRAYHIFTGPIYDNKGNLKIEHGEYATREQIISMNWLVNYVDGEIPSMEAYKNINDLNTGKIVEEV